MNVITVSTQSELTTALTQIDGPTTILLESGNYGDFDLNISIHSHAKFPAEVILKSADPESPAVFNTVDLDGVENLTFDNVRFEYEASSGDAVFSRLFTVEDSSNISFLNSVFDGDIAHGVSDIADGSPTGYALVIENSSDIKVDGNAFQTWMRAGVFANIDNLTVSNNEVSEIRTDGFDFVSVRDVLIEGNHIHDFVAAPNSGDHRDMIQFWPNEEAGAIRNVVIRGNVLDVGEGDNTQSIFMRNGLIDPNNPDHSLFYENILIEDNVIRNSHTHGISVGEAHGLTIQNNTLLYKETDGSSIPTILVNLDIPGASTNVLIQNNILQRLLEGSQEGVTYNNNLIVQSENPELPNYVGDLFVNPLVDGLASKTDLMALPASVIEQLGVGADLTQFNLPADGLLGFIVDEGGSGLERLSQSLDVSNIFDSTGMVDMTNATVSWDFGDGTTGTGVNNTHTFSSAGSYTVKATVALNNGQTVSIEKVIEVHTSTSLFATFDNGANDMSDVINPVTVGEAVTFENGMEGQAAHLNGDQITYARSADLINNSEYTLMVDFKKDVGDESSQGLLVYFSSSFILKVEADGIRATVSTDQGASIMQLNGLDVENSNWHRLALTFSGTDGNAILYLDGSEVGRVEGLQGATQIGSDKHDLSVGHASAAGFTGLVDNFQFWRGALSAEQVQTLASPDQHGSYNPTGIGQDDNIEGSSEDDMLDGGYGNDRLMGLAGDDVLLGGDDDDVLIGGEGRDQLLGGNGTNDAADYRGADGEVHINLLTGAGFGGEAQGDILDSIERVYLSNHGNGSITGNNDANVLIGNDDDNQLRGLGGNDLLRGGHGADLLNGGKGFDTVDYRNSDKGVWVNLKTGVVSRGEAEGDTLLKIENVFGSNSDDRDILEGSDYANVLRGYAGDDFLAGYGGNDYLLGGSGNDTFHFDAGTGLDRIMDFEDNVDRIELDNFGAFSTAANALAYASDVDGDVVLNFGVGGKLIVENATIAQVADDLFIV